MQGDIEKWQLISPAGEVFVNRNNPLKQSYRSWVSYSGTKKVLPRIWQGKYELWRGNKLIFEAKENVMVQ